MRWQPHVTVAAIIERDGKYLMVEEHTPDGVRLNQPAGHWEPGETLLDAVVRETLEETAYPFHPHFFSGVYQWTHPRDGSTFLRFAYTGDVGRVIQGRALDKGIIRAVWMSYPDIMAARQRHRSPMVQQCIEDHQANQWYPLSLVQAVV
jgi:8-oxo-dGTP pyrophosphatase MutT (NUDIX family)